jgi:hypothetical protein
MNRDIKVTIEYDGFKAERTIPVGDLKDAALNLSAYCGISPEFEMVSTLEQHINWTLSPPMILNDKPHVLRSMVVEIVEHIFGRKL